MIFCSNISVSFDFFVLPVPAYIQRNTVIGHWLTKDEDYAFAFNALKKAVLEFHGVDFKPKYLVADAAQATSNGFGLALGFKPVRIMCWYHMKTKVEDALSKVTKNHRDQLLNEIVIMQQFMSKDVFE
ncbi:hypothetical protein BpHYR1_031807 [Brachionus plicatilis]|uniref:MULE transposase domain-containing protein n=1 Tax=Brachionus plicatilis TaxID=10195 RepID=A0A3M7PV13_BRAPC|nr:hypothetical protein BpHYR1_031807 [Brachionus plicatilis]